MGEFRTVVAREDVLSIVRWLYEALPAGVVSFGWGHFWDCPLVDHPLSAQTPLEDEEILEHFERVLEVCDCEFISLRLGLPEGVSIRKFPVTAMN